MFEDTTEAPVSADTDDLDTFSDDLFGVKAKAPATEPIEPDPVEDTPEDEPKTEVEAEPKEGDEADDTEVKEEPKRNRVQERITQLVAEREKEKQEKLDLQRRLDELTASRETAPRTQPSVQDGPAPDDTMPDGSDKYPLGEFDPSYIRDMARHTIDKEWGLRKEQEAQEQDQRQQQQARDELQTVWVQKVETVQEEHKDFLEKTLELEETFDGLDPQFSDYLVQTIKSLDHGPEVLYYFANNLDEAKKFVRMGPHVATLALGEYNAMFKGQSRTSTPAKVSKAPTPPPSNKGGSGRTVVSADTDDLDAFTDLLFKGKR